MARTQKLSPMYPNLLENFTEDFLPDIPVEYIDSSLFSNVLIDYNHQTEENQSITFLDVALKKIQFKHHHAFSLEDILCMKLIDNYKKYEQLQEKLKELSHEIKINRETKDNLKKDFLKISPNKKDDIRFDATIRKYTGQVLKFKEIYREQLKGKKELMHNILSLWSDIEITREKLERKDTPYDLKIAKQTLSKSEYDVAWNDLYEEEWQDMLAKIEYDYGTKYIEYKESKLALNSKKTERKIAKPKIKIDEDKIQEEVVHIVNSIIVRDIVELSLEKDEINFTESKLLKHIYHFEIYVDKVFVCESDKHTSKDKWQCITLNEYFSIEIVPKNKTLRIVLMENAENAAEIQANINDFQRKNDDNFKKIIFLYENDINLTTDFVGSGHSIKEIAASYNVRLKSSNLFKENLRTTCEVSARIQWSENLNQSNSEDIRDSLSVRKKLNRLRQKIDKPTVDNVGDIIGKIYARDTSKDEIMINTLQQLCKSEFKVHEEFKIDENSAEFVRLKLLHLRNNGGFSNVKNKKIPIHGSQISTEQLNCLQKTKEKEFDLDYLREKESDMDPIELQRFISAKFVQKLNKKMLKNLNEHLMSKTRKDVVRECRNFNWRSVQNIVHNKIIAN